MIHIVTAENRRLFHHALMQMHGQRKRLFIDEMKWALDASSGIEIDAYDAPDATYLLDIEAPRAPVLASVRLLPTERPHLMSDVFPHLCIGGAPRGPRIWEATRFCPAPETPKGAARRARLPPIIAGIMETALLFGVEQVSFVVGAALWRQVRDIGWRVTALGPSQRSGGDRLTAAIAAIDAEGLKRVRDKNGLSAPLTRFIPGEGQVAA